MEPREPTDAGWDREIAELRHREELARRMGGTERVERQPATGRLTIRERVERLFDPGTFPETGPAAGPPAARRVGAHFPVTAKRTAQLFVAGPPVVAASMGESPDKEELGGARTQTKAGAVDNEAEGEDDAFAQLRRFLSYLPDNVWEAPPVHSPTDPPDRREEELIGIVPRDPRRPYKMRRILEAVLDRGSVFEIGSRFGPSLITALARLDGRPVGVLASDPNHY